MTCERSVLWSLRQLPQMWLDPRCFRYEDGTPANHSKLAEGDLFLELPHDKTDLDGIRVYRFLYLKENRRIEVHYGDMWWGNIVRWLEEVSRQEFYGT